VAFRRLNIDKPREFHHSRGLLLARRAAIFKA
jgi:hypothetical protein